MSEIQKDFFKEVDADKVLERNKNIATQQKVPWHSKLELGTNSIYSTGIKALVFVFGCGFLWQILRGDSEIIKLIEMTIDHGKVGYLAFATAFYLLAKNIFLFVDQNRSNK